ncbi:hypothetical protein BDZ85DRAFT_266939 [Elsinoe ampelina]|uniref:Uncharacterized protein n=1 Tax=Elsinoe ampelina TaxID=302913 RepID=A0A6A6G5H9_9PEZI|nr:hypothetical protein BDZ85DRAFT_266939 [Elsinoe ampelina]
MRSAPVQNAGQSSAVGCVVVTLDTKQSTPVMSIPANHSLASSCDPCRPMASSRRIICRVLFAKSALPPHHGHFLLWSIRRQEISRVRHQALRV